MITIPLSYERPPITTNRPIRNVHARQRVIDAIQAEVGWRVKPIMRANPGQFPIDHPVEVWLVWSVPDRRNRDSSGPDPTLKAAQDGLVAAGVLVDDNHTIVTESRCRIEIVGQYGMRLEITEAGE